MSQHNFTFTSKTRWPNQLLDRAAIVGHTTSFTSKLWFRLKHLGKYKLFIFSSEVEASNNLKSLYQQGDLDASLFLHEGVVEYEMEVLDYENDTTVVVDIENLQADMKYFYCVYSLEKKRVILGDGDEYSFRTLPKEEAYDFSFVFSSCNMPYVEGFAGKSKYENASMWGILLRLLQDKEKNNIKFMIGGGDQVYVDGMDNLDIWKYLMKHMSVTNGELSPSYDDMLSWYRDIYHGYWGRTEIRAAYAQIPNYMIWDDHEILDGWGSNEISDHDFNDLSRIFKFELSDKERILGQSVKQFSYETKIEALFRMKRAAEKTYNEYQHSHNPSMPDANEDQYDYNYEVGSSGFYVLDGRGERDFDKSAFKILGEEQFERFQTWLESDVIRKKKFIFVVAAVPVVHLKASRVKAADWDIAGWKDDMRDHWEHEAHDAERKAFLELLFNTPMKQKVVILSGDVHIAAAFSLEDNKGKKIHQLTSSAITYNLPRLAGKLLENSAAQDGVSSDGYTFKRLALYGKSNFSVIDVNESEHTVNFKLFGEIDKDIQVNPRSVGAVEPLLNIQI